MSPNNRLSQNEIQELQRDVLNILQKLEPVKHRIAPQDHRQLVNHLQYTLTTLRNMSNTIAVEQSDPYNSMAGQLSAKRVLYNQDGTTSIVDPSSVHTTGDGWENQFDENLLLKPPCFQTPPQNLTSLKAIRNASEQRRLANLTGF